MKQIILILLVIFSLSSCKEEKKKEFIPNPKYHIGESLYMKPDSTICYVKFYGVIKVKDTTYFYGIEYKDNIGVYYRRILRNEEIFGIKK